MRKLTIVALLCTAIAAQRQIDPVSKLDTEPVRVPAAQPLGQPTAEPQITAHMNSDQAGLGSPTALVAKAGGAGSETPVGSASTGAQGQGDPAPPEQAGDDLASEPQAGADLGDTGPESDGSMANPNTEPTDAGQDSEDPPAELDPDVEDMDAEQDADDPFADLGGDPFADLEADAAAEAAKEEASTLGKLSENLGGKAYLQYTGYFNDREKKRGGDNKSDFWNTALDLETWTSGENWRVDISAWTQAGNQAKTFSGSSPDDGGILRDMDELEHRHFVLNELYWTQSFESWDLTLGKKIAKNGLSTLYSPADVLRPVAGFDPLNVRDLGVWQAWADIFKGDYTWTLAVLPVYQPDKVPHPSSRWVNVNAGGAQPANNYPDIGPKDFGWFGRVKTVRSGWDLFASLYAGPGRQYVLKQAAPLPARPERNVPDVINPALGYSTTRGRWEFHGEVVHTNALRGQDQDYFTFVQGTTLTIDGDYVTHRGLEQILATVEVAWEARTGDQTASHFITTSDSMRTGQSDLITRLQFKVNDEFSMEYSGHYIFQKWGYANRFGSKWEILNNLTWNNGFEFFGGTAGHGPAAGLNNLGVNYGGWTRNNRFISALEYKF